MACTESASRILHYVKNVYFRNKVGEQVFFDANGNPPAVYDILQWQLSPAGLSSYARVGQFNSSATAKKALFINDSSILWDGDKVPQSVCSTICQRGFRKIVQPGQPVCCFDCVPCSLGEIANQSDSAECLRCPIDQWPNEGRDKCLPKKKDFLSYAEPLGLTLTTLALFCFLTVFIIFIIFIKYCNTPVVKANNRNISYILLSGLMLSSLSCLMFIGNPRTPTCMLRQAAFGIIFVLCVSCVLAKTVLVVIAFNSTKPNSSLKKYIGSKLPNAIVCGCTFIQVLVCTIWLGTFPPFPEDNMASLSGTVVVGCNEGSPVAFWCVLGYMGALSCISFAVAFLSRKLPDTFNEAKFITFSMLIFISVWLSFIPAYLSTHGKYMVVVEIFAILSSSAGLTICIFLPKCYIILIQSHMNTRDFLLGRNAMYTRKLQ
ncbi:vomeronasal type-2 receptor 26-like [Protopterus annectens]|uniref:vomeronasal type-2 receptor 26-like n=1 Tax=Protopterus annectens TaxID=7888 RepID=UPI001CFA74D9|nr:vomeronasal type-2 receptor 26-like [Protopterus annectens]